MINRNTSKFLNEGEKKLKENRFDTLEYLYIDGSYALIRKYEQGPFLKKILNGNVFDRLYRHVSAGKLKTKDNPFNVKNWKVGDDILLGLTSTLPFEDPKNLKKDLQVNFSYCMVFKDAKGYSVKYDAKDFAGNVRGIERYKWQKEVLTAGLFHVDNIEQKGKITYVGETNYDNVTIFIEKGETEDMIKTLVHEVMHVWMYENGYSKTG